jgi:rare lipoprotein A
MFHFIDHLSLKLQNQTALEFAVPPVIERSQQLLPPCRDDATSGVFCHSGEARACRSSFALGNLSVRLWQVLLCAVLLWLALTAIGCGGKKQTARNVPPAPSIPDQSSASKSKKKHAVTEASDFPAARDLGPLASVPGIHVDPNARVIWTEVGYASWYGPNYHNKKGANGEIYNQNEMTAAHNTLPMNSIVRVVNLVNNQATVVRITDRGPFVGDRIIDLSAAAAKAVNVYLPGTARVRLDVLEAPHPIETGGRWCVQIGAFKEQSDAVYLKEQLLNRYPSAQVLQFKGPTGYWVRIRVAQDDKDKTREVFEHTHADEGGVFMVRLD